MNKHKVTIESPTYGDLNGVSIFLTSDLLARFEKETSKPDGRPLLEKLREGTAIQGLKHLITKIKGFDKEAELVLTESSTRREGKEFYINYGEYKKRATVRFYELYRETGLDVASSYLNLYFPDDFEYSASAFKDSEIKRVSRSLPEIISSVADTERNKVALIEGATESLKKYRRRNKTLSLALQNLQQQSSFTFFRNRLDELRTRLQSTKGFGETRGKYSWQNWIYENKWLFGMHYLTPIQKQRIGYDNIPDYLFPTFDGFLDILEIKLPKFDVIKQDPSHAGSWAWCPETNKAIGQVVNYLQEMEKGQLQLADKINEKYGKDYDITIYSVKPRAFVVIGNSETWNPVQKKALRNLNYSLHGIQVLTYFDLLTRGESIIAMLSIS